MTERNFERPNWNTLTEKVRDLRAATAKMNDLQRQMLSLSGVAWSDDGMVKAVVGPRGHLTELEIDPRVYRTPNSKALAATIVATVKVAIEQVQNEAQDLADEILPSDMKTKPLGRLDPRALARTHDADLSIEEDDNGLS